MSSDFLSQVSDLPSKITKTTDSISKGANKLDSLVNKMSQILAKWNTNNRVTGGLKSSVTTLANGAGHLTNILTNSAKNIENIGKTVSNGIAPLATAAGKIKQYSDQLVACKDVVTTSALVVNAIVDSVSGHFHPRAAEQALSKFDGQWDQWAKTVNDIYSHLSPSGQTNILESLAKGGFGDNVFLLGSVIKNESAGIFGGIADFEDAIHMFRGSYRNPIEAAVKIEKGVKNIVKATERVANSLNNMVKVFQKGKGLPVTGNPILSYLAELHSNKAISTVNKALTLGGAASTVVSDASVLANALKSKNPSAIFKAGKQTYNDVKKITKELKSGEGNIISKELTGTATGGAAPIGQSAQEGNKREDNNKKQKKEDEKINSGSADSYVCSGAIMKCTQGSSPAKLTVLPSRTVWLTGQPMANISDHQSFVNLGAFGRCKSLGFPATASATAANHGHLTPMPCMHNTPFPWMGGKNDVLVKGQQALLKSSKCNCVWGGEISLTSDGQSVGNKTPVSTVPREVFKTKSAKKSVISEKDASKVIEGFHKLSDIEKKEILRDANALPDNISVHDRLKLAEYKKYLAQKWGIKNGNPMSIEEADKQSANPNYAKGNDYSVNCATVAAAYVLRLQGLNVTAKPKNDDNRLNVWLSKGNSFKIWKNVDGSEVKPSTYVDWMNSQLINNKPITEMTPELYKRFIDEHTKDEGVYIITVGWEVGGGHATIIQKYRDENGDLQLSYIEPQVYNEKLGVKQSIDNLVQDMDKTPLPTRGIMRVDDKMFDSKYVALFNT